MKYVLRLTTIASVLTLGLASQAQAVPSLQLIACQGTVCAATPVTVGTNIDIPAPVTVGDYTIDASGAAIETALISNAQETSIDVKRIASASATALDVWLVATGYNLPNPPGVLNTTHGATFVDIGAASAPSLVSFQGWISTSNSGLAGVPAGGGAFVAGGGGLTPPAGAQSNGTIACTPIGGPPLASCSVNGAATGITGGSVPFSLITKTTFNIPQAVTGDAYTSNSQVAVGLAVPDEASTMLLLAVALVSVVAARRAMLV